ncbi:MAG: hypothetical protein PHG60_02080 [Candidatus Dojkabacteria bacterium]|jgi:hypothetical protein|nr:hypothetical protein [Candidatus Dojkabacteria bacterium]MDD2270347.1 hypothetical protein [Candidatus Dojkabacteria bacterium]
MNNKLDGFGSMNPTIENVMPTKMDTLKEGDPAFPVESNEINSVNPEMGEMKGITPIPSTKESSEVSDSPQTVSALQEGPTTTREKREIDATNGFASILNGKSGGRFSVDITKVSKN